MNEFNPIVSWTYIVIKEYQDVVRFVIKIFEKKYILYTFKVINISGVITEPNSNLVITGEQRNVFEYYGFLMCVVSLLKKTKYFISYIKLSSMI